MVTRTQRKRQATQEAIVAAAQALLAEGGPAAVTLEALADRADVAVQTIYNRIGGRDAVLLAVAGQAMEANRGYLDRAYATAGTVVERLRAVAAAYAHFALEEPDAFQLLAFPPPGAPEPEQVRALAQEQHGKLAALLREGLADGTIGAGLDPDVAAVVLWRMFDGVLSLAFRPDQLRVGPAELPALLEMLDSLLRHGLGGPRPRQEPGQR